jgi:carbon storage regulator
MLVLTRKVGEHITIGNNVIVTIVQIGQGRVRIGFTAPKEVEIMRKEVKDFLLANPTEKRKGKDGPAI